jgi:HEPN domain-containing protein
MDEAKRELVQSWLAKASHDLEAARLLGSDQTGLLDIAVYHCQQAAEKAPKGYLVAWDVRPGKTQDVGRLLGKAAEIEPEFGTWLDAAQRLTPFATEFRYPGVDEAPSQEDYEEAVDDADTNGTRIFVTRLRKLG